jgi:hypothetical protein
VEPEPLVEPEAAPATPEAEAVVEAIPQAPPRAGVRDAGQGGRRYAGCSGRESRIAAQIRRHELNVLMMCGSIREPWSGCESMGADAMPSRGTSAGRTPEWWWQVDTNLAWQRARPRPPCRPGHRGRAALAAHPRVVHSPSSAAVGVMTPPARVSAHSNGQSVVV